MAPEQPSAAETPRPPRRPRATRIADLLDDARARIGPTTPPTTTGPLPVNEVERSVFRDRLTGLPNRLSLEQEMTRLESAAASMTVVVLDVDDFRAINDARGAETGDAVLRAIGSRLAGYEGLRAFHLGGDEFALLGAEAKGPAGLGLLVSRLQTELARPWLVGSVPVTLSASIGVATGPLHQDIRGHQVLRIADDAMHQAKREGPGRVAVRDEDATQRLALRTRLAERLEGAEGRGELEVYYQPILRVADRTWATVEALVRWNAPDGVVPPSEFIPLAEESGQIRRIGAWVLERAVADLAVLRARTGLTPRVNVNVSAEQLTDPLFLGSAADLLRSSGLEPRSVVLELTESLLLVDPEATISALTEAHTAGLGLALDDFGTGYSSLSYLVRLPFDVVKLDRSFVTEIATSTRAQRLVGALVQIAHDLDMSVTVEGVETEEQLAALAAVGCDTVQGYLFSRPLPLEDLIAATTPRA
ncbi:bifunctional diguanylate cyclase/phosphodiesterase [Actinotalea sp. BY-33]|uniref:Bifunctional diguanylate cyclase/phosphodiesterase n=1 Tax=Actinotalea soli TaxID=2819234 RepID=A0A939RTG8_9CELL|nr:bifunctional diguanylate cyclase/phosphodiesterase [Actinotalea soli]MBO1751134.1 bifunctional diguanylate cyclase/phosphodiesterase [Actinotalea soli]